jgi:hypothetical protein
VKIFVRGILHWFIYSLGSHLAAKMHSEGLK